MNAPVIPIAAARAPDAPICDLELEAALLTALLLQPEKLVLVSDYLSRDTFYSERHALTYEAIRSLTDEGKPVELVTVLAELRRVGRSTQVGGLAYLETMMASVPAIASPVEYAIRLKNLSRLRRMTHVASKAVGTASGTVEDPQAFLEATARAVAAIARDNPTPAVESNLDALKRIFREIANAPNETSPEGVRVGLHWLDEAIAGLRPGKKTTVVAYTGVGKSAFGLQAARVFAARGARVLFATPEVGRDEHIVRLISQVAKVDHDGFRKRTLTKACWDRIYGAMPVIQELLPRIEFMDAAEIDVDQIASRAERMCEQTKAGQPPLALVVVDYVQRLKASHVVERLKENQQVAHSTRQLKVLARRLGVSVLELAQGKAGEKGKKSRPIGSQDSQVIDKEADALVVLHRENGGVTAYVDKNRDGQVGVEVPLRFTGEWLLFEDPNDPREAASRQWVDRGLED